MTEEERMFFIADKYMVLRALCIPLTERSEPISEWIMRTNNKVIIALFYEVLIAFKGHYEGKEWVIPSPGLEYTKKETNMIREYRNMILHVPDDTKRFEWGKIYIKLDEPLVRKVYDGIYTLGTLVGQWGLTNPEIVAFINHIEMVDFSRAK
jgi:hypothetical protein